MEDIKIENIVEDRLKSVLHEIKDIMILLDQTEIEVSGIIPDTNTKQTLHCYFEREED